MIFASYEVTEIAAKIALYTTDIESSFFNFFTVTLGAVYFCITRHSTNNT